MCVVHRIFEHATPARISKQSGRGPLTNALMQPRINYNKLIYVTDFQPEHGGP